jgi:hypothetical protein
MLTRVLARLFTALGLCAAAALPGRAGTMVWTNLNGGLWGAATNWSPNGVPGASDSAVVTNVGDYTVALDANRTVGGLTLGYAGSSTSTQVLAVNTNTLTSSGAATLNSHGQLNLGSGAAVFNGGGSLYDGSAFTGSGSAQLKLGTFTLYGNVNSSSNVVLAGATLAGTQGVLSGLWTWTNGSLLISGASRLTIATNGVLVLAGVNTTDYQIFGILTNAGTLRLASGNFMCNGNNGEGNLVNLPGSFVDLVADVSITRGNGSPFIENRGTLRKTGGTGTSTIVPAFINYSVVDVPSGVLLFQGGGSLYDGSAFTGSGSAQLKLGTFTLYGNVNSSSNVLLAGGTLAGTDGVLSGLWTWTNGSVLISGASRLTIATNGVLLLAGVNNTDYELFGILTNAGTLRLASGNFMCNGNFGEGHLVNLPGAFVDLVSDVSITKGNGSPSIVNQGTLRKLGGTGTSTIVPAFINYSVVDVPSGVLLFQGGGSLYDGSAFTGSGSAQLKLGTFTLYGNVNSSSNVLLAGGTLAGTDGVLSGLWTWTNGSPLITVGDRVTIATNGVLVLAGVNNTDYRLYGILTNAGTLQLASGNFMCDGNSGEGHLVNLPGAFVDLVSDVSITKGNLSPSIVNQGTLRKLGGTGTSTIVPAFINCSVVDVPSGVLLFRGGGSLYDGSAFTGSGSAQLKLGTFTLDGNVNSSSNVVLAGATLAGTQGVLSGLWTWTNGSYLITVGDRVTIATNGVLVLAGVNNTDYQLFGILTNAGTLRLASGNFMCDGNFGEGHLVNLPGAFVDLVSDVSITKGNGSPSIVNQGTLRKSGGTGTSTIEPAFINYSVVDVPSGVLLFQGGGSLYDGSAFTGSGSAQLKLGAFTLDGNVSSSSNVMLAGATLAGTQGVLSGLWTWTNGSYLITGGNRVTIATNGVLVLAGVNNTDYRLYGILTNAGMLRLASGNFTCDGNSGEGHLVNLPGALVDMVSDVSIGRGNGSPSVVNRGAVRKSGGTGTSGIGPNFNNYGTLDVQSGTLNLGGTYNLSGGALNFGLTSLANYGRISLAGSAALTGTVGANFNTGFCPVAGSRFDVLTYGSRTGIFTNQAFPPRTSWGTNYGATSFSLIVSNVQPTLLSIPNQVAKELVSMTVTASAVDSDPGQTLTFGLVSAPSGMQINTNTGVITWTPALGQGNTTNTVVVNVLDSGTPRLGDTNSFKVVVRPANLPPVMGALQDRVVRAGATVAFRATATDPDDPPDILTFALDIFSLIPPDPTNVTFNMTTGDFSWPTTEADVGNQVYFVITVADNGHPVLRSSRSFLVDVLPANPCLLCITLTNHQARLSWNSESNYQYQVECTPGLAVPCWTNLGPVHTATGDRTVFIDDTGGGGTNRYYRVRELSEP